MAENIYVIEYNPDAGVNVPDGKILEFVKKWAESPYDVTICNWLVIDAFRLAIANGEINPRIVTLRYTDIHQKFDKYGTPEMWIKGMGDIATEILSALCKARAKQKD